jgi:hypothetical protein
MCSAVVSTTDTSPIPKTAWWNCPSCPGLGLDPTQGANPHSTQDLRGFFLEKTPLDVYPRPALSKPILIIYYLLIAQAETFLKDSLICSRKYYEYLIVQ